MEEMAQSEKLQANPACERGEAGWLLQTRTGLVRLVGAMRPLVRGHESPTARKTKQATASGV